MMPNFAPAQTFTTLVFFNSSNGATPMGALIQGTDGRIYGTTHGGGVQNAAAYDGSVFKVTPTGALTTLIDFCPQTPCVDGKNPYAGVIQGADGNFYGTTSAGGTNNLGTVFKLTPSGALTILYSFPGGAPGRSPAAPLLQAANGELYGTTAYGGNLTNTGYGTIFKITTSGTLTTIHTFESTDGVGPGVMVLGTDGNFYGITGSGGTLAGGGKALGTVFQMTPAGVLTTLHNFAGRTSGDGSGPNSLTQGTDGSFYGTTSRGGTSKGGDGTVFKITSAGALTILHNFDYTDGFVPSEIVEGTDGNFYGTTSSGGTGNACVGAPCGTVFQMIPGGTLTTLHSFDGTDGATPSGGLLQSTNGVFYGTTSAYGNSSTCSGTYTGCGTLFSLSMGLGPFVITRPTSGTVGTKVTILGTSLSGTTAVSFNGTPATYTATGSAINTTVPTGATSGTVTVTTPSGTLSSNVVFNVMP